METGGEVETQAISFVFQIAFWIVSGITTLLIIFIWNQSKDIKKNKENSDQYKDDFNKQISALKIKLAVNTERDSHIDDQLKEIRKWMETINGEIKQMLNGK